jgi:CRISPR-associated protein Cas1
MSKESYYIFSSGELKRKDNSITLYKENVLKKDIPIERIKDIYVFSEVVYNSKLFEFLGSNGINVHMFNYYNYYVGSFYPKENKISGKLLVAQVMHYTDKEKRVKIAKEFIIAASFNILRNLKYYQNRGKELNIFIDEIEKLRIKLNECKTIEEIMGIEGNIRKVYYSSWKIIINQEIDFEKRIKRPPDTMVNVLISFLNSVLYAKTLSIIYQTQINPTISYLHEPGTKRFSLTLDICEVFNPLIVDRTIFSLLNKNIINEKDFVKEDYYLRIKEEGMKKVLKELEEALKRTIMHKKIKRNVSYEHLIKLELYKLIKHLLEEQEYQGFKIWW